MLTIATLLSPTYEPDEDDELTLTTIMDLPDPHRDFRHDGELRVPFTQGLLRMQERFNTVPFTISDVPSSSQQDKDMVESRAKRLKMVT
jgi:hypothetical protein